MKTTELRELSLAELDAKIAATKAEIADIKLKLASKSEVEKPVRVRGLRRDVARMLTIREELAKKEAK